MHKNKNIMKKAVQILVLILATNLMHAQSALDLMTGSQVRNSIIFENPDARPVSTGISVRFSASDSALPAGNNNIHLPVTPFSSGFEIGMESLAFDRGNRLYLNVFDTVDLGFNPRISCDDVDIGAFEVPIIATQITVQPTLAGRVCEGSSVLLHVEAIGDGITFQWQRNGVNLIGRTSPTLAIPNVSMADMGYYRVIVFGACCNDTSQVVRLDVDLRPMVVAMNDTTILSGEDVTLHVVEFIGTVFWFESDMETVVLNPNITNITESTQFFAVATNGVCTGTAIASVQIIVDGFVCRVRTFSDSIICSGEAFRLLIYEATTIARWFLAGATTELPNGSLVRPTETTQFVLVGFDDDDNVCWRDTLTLTVPEVELNVRSSSTYCMGTTVDLFSAPVADAWFNADNNLLGTGNISVTPPLGTTTIYTAQRTDPLTGCTARRTVAITVNPPDLTLPFANFVEYGQYALTVCEGDLIHLQTNIDPIFIIWERLSDNTNLENDPTITATVSDVFRAHGWDPVCGNVFVDVTVTVEPMPDFEVLPQSPIYAGTSISLMSVPNTPIWTDIHGTRVFMPVTLLESQYFVGVFQHGACEVRDTIFVEVMDVPPPPLPSPNMQATLTTTIATNRDCDNATMTINVTGGVPPYDFQWRRLGGNDVWRQPNNDGELRLFNVLAGLYSFTVFDSEDNYIQFQISVRCEHEQVVPTILVTPNNDGLNDYLFIYEIEFFPINRVTILNSYGAEIITIENFCNYDPNRRWDGRNRNNQFVPDGTYWYVIQAQGVPPMTGWIIVRGSPGR